MMKRIIIAFLMVAGLIGCTQQVDCNCAQEPPEQKWTWTEDRFYKAVEKVRAGRDLTPLSWPDGNKVAVLLSFDVDNETVAWWDGEPSATDLSRGEYGSRVALKRVVDLLDKEEVPASFSYLH